MAARNTVLILFLVPLLCAAHAARANAILLQTLSNQELAANVTGASVAIAFRDGAENDRAGMTGIGDNAFGNFFGIQTISTDIGANAVSQAATSLVVRASLMEGVHSTGSAGF